MLHLVTQAANALQADETKELEPSKPKLFRLQGVGQSSELMRVLSIPKRTLDLEGPEALELAELLTKAYKTPQGTMTLKPIQAVALCELHDFGGLLGPIPVGGGKTLISFLAATVLEAKRPLLIIPAKLIRKTTHEAAELQKHFRFPIPEIISYEKIRLVNYKNFLPEYRPDLIVADESHKMKSRKAATTRRVAAYFKAAHDPNNDGTVIPKAAFVCLSGTLTSRSLQDYSHLSDWALQDLSPLPRQWHILREWSAALDEKVQPNERMSPGALLSLLEPSEAPAYKQDPLRATRAAFSRRFLETPGVISTRFGSLGCALNIVGHVIDLPSTLDAHFLKLRTEMETPDGWPFSFMPQLWSHARELGNGFYYAWSPRPPEEWIDARKQWARFVTDMSARRWGGESWDSEKDVANGVDQGKIPDPLKTLLNWRTIRPSFTPNSVPEWVDDTAINWVKKWAETNNGIIWTGQRAFAERLHKETGFRYFFAGGADAKGRIDETSASKDGCIIASIASNGEGLNLQKGWDTNLLTSIPSTNRVMEQLIGRTHRDGQESDEVTFDIMLACYEDYGGFVQAQNDAVYQNETQKTPQKLLSATLDFPTEEDVYLLGLKTPRWRKGVIKN